MSDKYKDRFRGYLIDNHSPAPPAITFSKLSLAEHGEFFEKAKIDSLMVYCKDHWGYSYYNTRLGERHPALDRDWVGEVAGELRRRDIEFNAYYCIEYDNRITVEHPDWAVLTASGADLRCGARNAKWRMPCYMTAYREHALGQLKEIVSAYRPDSLFLDIFGKSLCYCPECRRLYQKKTGRDLPETSESIAVHAPTIIEFLDDCAEAFLDDVLSAVKGIDPGLPVTINFSSHYPKRIRDKLDYHFTEPWAGNWLSAAFARATGKYPQLGPGDVSKIFNYQRPAVYIAAAAQIAAQGCRVFMYSEPQRPDGSLETEESKRLGIAYAEVRKYSAYLGDRTAMADIAILHSDASRDVGTDGTVVPGAIGRARTPNRHMTALLGAMKACDYSKRLWTVVSEGDLSAGFLTTIRVLILPEVFVLKREAWDSIAAFMDSGGTVLATGETGLRKLDGSLGEDFIFSRTTGVHFAGLRDDYAANHYSGYVGFKSREGFLAGLPDTTPPVGKRTIRFTAPGEPLAVYVEPAVLVGPETWVNWGYPPPSRWTDEALIGKVPCGSGAFYYLGFDAFGIAGDDAVWVKPFLAGLLAEVHPDPLFHVETVHPESIGCTAFRRPGEIILHLVSFIPTITGGDAPPVPVGSLVFSSAAARAASGDLAVRQVYPEERDLAVLEIDGCFLVDLGNVDIHNIVIIKGLEA